MEVCTPHNIGKDITRVLKGASPEVGLTAAYIAQYITAPTWMVSKQLKPSINEWLYNNENTLCSMVKGKTPPHWVLITSETKDGDKTSGDSEGSQRRVARSPVVLVDIGNVHDVCSNVQSLYGSTVVLRAFTDKRFPGHIPIDYTIIANTTMRHAAEMLLITALFEELNKPGSVDIFICSKGKMFSTFAAEVDVSRINPKSTLSIVSGWDELKLLL